MKVRYIIIFIVQFLSFIPTTCNEEVTKTLNSSFLVASVYYNISSFLKEKILNRGDTKDILNTTNVLIEINNSKQVHASQEDNIHGSISSFPKLFTVLEGKTLNTDTQKQSNENKNTIINCSNLDNVAKVGNINEDRKDYSHLYNSSSDNLSVSEVIEKQQITGKNNNAEKFTRDGPHVELSELKVNISPNLNYKQASIESLQTKSNNNEQIFINQEAKLVKDVPVGNLVNYSFENLSDSRNIRNVNKEVAAIDYSSQLIGEERKNVNEANNNIIITKTQPFLLKEDNRNSSNIIINKTNSWLNTSEEEKFYTPLNKEFNSVPINTSSSPTLNTFLNISNPLNREEIIAVEKKKINLESQYSEPSNITLNTPINSSISYEKKLNGRGLSEYNIKNTNATRIDKVTDKLENLRYYNTNLFSDVNASPDFNIGSNDNISNLELIFTIQEFDETLKTIIVEKYGDGNFSYDNVSVDRRILTDVLYKLCSSNYEANLLKIYNNTGFNTNSALSQEEVIHIPLEIFKNVSTLTYFSSFLDYIESFCNSEKIYNSAYFNRTFSLLSTRTSTYLKTTAALSSKLNNIVQHNDYLKDRDEGWKLSSIQAIKQIIKKIFFWKLFESTPSANDLCFLLDLCLATLALDIDIYNVNLWMEEVFPKFSEYYFLITEQIYNNNFFVLPNMEGVPFAFVTRLMLTKGTRILIWSDLHGTLSSLLFSLKNLIQGNNVHGFKNLDKINSTYSHLHKQPCLSPNFIVADHCRLVFLGDFVDRGFNTTEVIYVISLLRVLNGNKVIIIRGNHETLSMSWHYGLLNELATKYPNSKYSIYYRIVNLFQFLPSAVYVGIRDTFMNISNFIQLSHGVCGLGYSPRKLLSYDPSKLIINHEIYEVSRIEPLKYIFINGTNSSVYESVLLMSSKKESAFLMKYLKSRSLQKLSFLWSDILLEIKDNEHLLLNGSRLSISPNLIKLLFQNWSTGEFLLRGVIRGHQHHGSMLVRLRNSKGMVSSSNSEYISKGIPCTEEFDKDFWLITTVSGAVDILDLKQHTYLELQVNEHWEEWKLLQHWMPVTSYNTSENWNICSYP
jgi:hypothetical protein